MEPINVFLAFFDILGFKNLRATRGSKGLYHLYKKFIEPMVEHSAASGGKIVKLNDENLCFPNISKKSIKYKIISDSMILFTEDSSLESFHKIINSSFQLLQSGFSGSKAPLRGAISYGDLINDQKDIYVGSAIEDAYWNESRQVWSGCILTDNCRSYIENEKYNIPKNIIVEYNCPMQENPKESKIKYFKEEKLVLNWTLNMYDNAIVQSFPKSSSKHAIRIQNNTIDFEKWARNINI